MNSRWKKITFIILGFMEITAGSAPTRVTGCGGGAQTITLKCDTGSTIRITKGVCVAVPDCDSYDVSLESQCTNSDKTAQWAPYCETFNPCIITISCMAGQICPGDYTYIYADYECIPNETTMPTRMTTAAPEFTTDTPSPTPVTGCSGISPTISLECDTGSTIRITKGVCVLVPDCNSYDVSLESQCINSDKTAQWAPYCAVTNPCIITATCNAGQTCPGDNEYIYADYECIPNETTMPTRMTTAAPEFTTDTPSPTPAHGATPTTPLQADIVRQKGSLFKQIPGRRLSNHMIKMIKVKYGLSPVKCGAECNKLDDCVSFNIGNGYCELNNGMLEDADVSTGDFVDDEGCKYYEKV